VTLSSPVSCRGTHDAAGHSKLLLALQHVTADLHYGLCCGVQVKGAGLQEEQIAYICAESLKVSGAPLAIVVVAVLQTALSRLTHVTRRSHWQSAACSYSGYCNLDSGS
jgi:hypothetical protein